MYVLCLMYLLRIKYKIVKFRMYFNKGNLYSYICLHTVFTVTPVAHGLSVDAWNDLKSNNVV